MNRLDKNMKAMDTWLNWMGKNAIEEKKRKDERKKEAQHRKEEGL